MNMQVGLANALVKFKNDHCENEIKNQADLRDFLNDAKVIPACNVVGCLAGWTVTLTKTDEKSDVPLIDQLEDEGYLMIHDGEHTWTEVKEAASEILGLNEDEANRLFEPHMWPTDFKYELETLKPGTTKYAKLVVKRVQHFIKTKGRG